jgi:hypothetical protein
MTEVRNAGASPAGKKKATRKKAIAKKVIATVAKKKRATKRKATARKARRRLWAPEERYRLIAEIAYLKAEKRGFEGGDPIQDWLDAEQEVDSEPAD